MKVLLVYPDVHTYGGSYYTGVAALAAALKARGHECRLLHVTRPPHPGRVRDLARSYAPGLVGISATSLQFEWAQRLAGWIKEAVPAPVVCGGIHPTLCPEEAIGLSCFDMINVGEGDGSLPELADALEAGRDHTGIRNLWVRTAAGVVRNPLRPLVGDLDALPFPDRSIFEFQKFLDRWNGVARMMASRGCPFDCAFCSNHALRKTYQGLGPYVRSRSVASVIEEVDQLRRGYRIQRVDFDDDIFTLDPGWVRDFCRRWKEEVGLPFRVNARAETVTREMLRELKEGGCELVSMGVESGDEWLRTQVLRKRITDGQIVEAFRWAREEGLQTCSLNMVGMPHETPAMAEKTIRLNQAIAPDFIQATVFHPFPGTELHTRCLREGLLTAGKKESFFQSGSILDQPTMTPRQLRRSHNRLKSMGLSQVIRARYRWFFPVYAAMEAILGPLGLTSADLLIAVKHAPFALGGGEGKV